MEKEKIERKYVYRKESDEKKNGREQEKEYERKKETSHPTVYYYPVKKTCFPF